MLFRSRKAPYTQVASGTDGQDALQVVTAWLPYALQGPALLLFALYDCALLVAIVILYWKSYRDFGLIDDDGTSDLVFVSRFLPTLLAVAYVLFATIIVDDVRRTEPFALLASPAGALARYTLLQNPGQWWTCIWRSFPNRKQDRGMRWAMLCSVLIYVLGILVLSPFSASLLVSKEVLIPEDTLFRLLNLPTAAAPLSIQAKQATYFRTVAHDLQNVSTSAWITDKYFVFPFWPSTLNSPPLGPVLSDQAQTWQANTTVMTTEMVCEPMTLERKAWEVNQTADDEAFINASMVLSTKSGCKYGVFFPWTWSGEDAAISIADFANYGGASWAPHTALALAPGGASEEAFTYSGDLINSSSCTGELLFMSTNPINFAGGLDFSVNHNFNAFGHICKHEYYAGDLLVTAKTSQDSTELSFDEEDFRHKRQRLDDRQLDTAHFQDLFFDKNWSYHLISVNGDRPLVGGPTALLSAMYNFTMEAMIKDPDLTGKATSLKQRFFGEIVQDAVSSLPPADSTVQIGSVSTIRQRVTVVSIAALTLGITLTLQLLLICGTFFASRLSRRPLALLRDPASALAVASLLPEAPDARHELRCIGCDLGSKAAEGGNRYKLQGNRLCLIDPAIGSSAEERKSEDPRI